MAEVEESPEVDLDRQINRFIRSTVIAWVKCVSVNAREK